MLKTFTVLAALLTALSVLTACGDDQRSAEQETRTAANGDKFNDADVEFASDMIQHHSQALAMVDLTMGRKVDPEVQQIAENIRMAQGPEIEQMTDWLSDWGEPIPESVRDHANAEGDGNMKMSDMPGMMSTQEMHELESAQGAQFQKMWLEMMIDHHEGAIEMARVEQSEGRHAPAIELAEEVESTQQDEISAMQALLEKS